MSEALINGMAGAGGGIIAQLITYPLQSVNTRQQTERGAIKEKTVVHQMCEIVKREGWGSLYGGLMPSLAGTAASQGVYYYFYEIFRNKAEWAAVERMKLGSGDGSVGMLSTLLVAAFSGCVNVLITNPIWVIVTRLQIRSMAPYGTLHAVREVYGEAGVLGFWKGVFPTLFMVSNPSIQFMLYETMLKKRRTLANRSSASEVFLLGALAKLGATVLTYPLLVVKSRLQAKQLATADKSHHYQGTLDAVLKMICHEGVYGFYKGMSTKIVQSVLAGALLFMVKEELVRGARLLLAPKTESKP